MYTHLRRAAAVITAAMIELFAAAGYYAWKLPDSYYIASDETLTVPSLLPITAEITEEDALAAFSNDLNGTGTASLRLLGIIPIKEAEVQEIDTPMLVPGGEPFGIRLQMDGVMVIRLGVVDTGNGTVCPAKDAGLCAGDIIEAVNGYPITSSDVLREAVFASEGKTVEIEFTRDDKSKTCELTPVYSISECGYTAGIWVRDSLAGVGTMTFYDPETMSFGGLGHPICDGDTGVCIPIGEGSACPITVSGVKKGTSGNPGMLEGTFQNESALGTLLCNNRCGVFGKLNVPLSSEEAIPMAFKQEIKTGEAEIICTVSGTEPKHYSIEIESIDLSGTDNTKNMILRITDPELLEKTGGIVQGMSGSPIIQNGKLVGAVTHVFVDDPTKGYGIFCENMYKYGTVCSG